MWDDDETSSDYLGGYELDIGDILATKNRQKRSLAGPSTLPDADPDDDFSHVRKGQWFEQEHYVRVFDGSRTEIKGSSLPQSGSGAPLIHFE